MHPAAAIGPPLAAVLVTGTTWFAPANWIFGAMAGLAALLIRPPIEASGRMLGALEECAAGE